MIYYAIVERTTEGTYAVAFPDLPGCTSAGATLPDAQEKAAVAATAWLADADETPTARDRDALLKDSEVSSALATGSLLVAVEASAPARAGA